MEWIACCVDRADGNWGGIYEIRSDRGGEQEKAENEMVTIEWREIGGGYMRFVVTGVASRITVNPEVFVRNRNHAGRGAPLSTYDPDTDLDWNCNEKEVEEDNNRLNEGGSATHRGDGSGFLVHSKLASPEYIKITPGPAPPLPLPANN
ncbi:hypothetical protein BDK51DRAFT_26057 [Blyttiomyces helicus]|uniref:Uncharacterized protein n=1 Tax=Blyttiomyces helicus TaxID=388810 RepID=A0A4P9WME7_9FUNG|nr:hypothetical protein BDK51DRAFT_26057 [Blyttiomyces helicus]|eukprot:RKO94084.1 hypothetical protein BDK51DRAFT_26057 [Blyttiomyces helicus]